MRRWCSQKCCLWSGHAAESKLSDVWNIAADGQTAYDLSVYGPNGFLRSFRGSIAGTYKTDLRVNAIYGRDEDRGERGWGERSHEGITLEIINPGRHRTRVQIHDAYTGQTATQTLAGGETLSLHYRLERSYGWYDFTVQTDADSTFLRRVAGHVETGEDSKSDPAIGTV